MKKLLLLLPLFAGASWAGTTYYSGAQTEPAYNRLLEQLNGTELFAVKSKEYVAGFMNSTALTEVRMKDDATDEVLFTLKHKINHSPVSMVPATARFGAANIITTLVIEDIPDPEARNFLQKFDTGEPFVMTTDVAMDGATASELKINGIDHTEGNQTLTTSGAVVNFATTSDGSVTGDLLAKDFLIAEGNEGKGELSELSVDFDLTKLDDAETDTNLFFNMNFDAKLGEGIFFDTDSNENIQIKDAHYTYNQELANDSPFVKFSMGVDELISDVVPLKSAKLDSSLTGFSMTEMMANADFYKDLATIDKPEELFFSPKGLEILRATFKPDTKLKLVTNVSTVDGDVDADISLWFTGNGSDDGYTGMVTTGDLAKTIAGTAKANADRSALNGTPIAMMLDEPLAQNYLTITEDTVSLNADLDRLVLKLDGQVIPLELMAGEMLDMPLAFVLQMM